MEIRETDTTFHGRRVIQVDEMFFVDSEIGTPVTEARWVSDQRANLFYKGCVYNRIDHTKEFWRLVHPDQTAPEPGTVVYQLNDDGTEEEVGVLHPSKPSCVHAA